MLQLLVLFRRGGCADPLIRFVRELFGFQAFRCVELDLKPESGLWSTPLCIDSLVLLAGPKVLQLDQLEPLRLKPLDVREDTASVALRAVRKRESDGVGHDSQRVLDGCSW